MPTVNVQFSDATQTKMIAAFGSAQDATIYPNMAAIPDSDARYQAFMNPAIGPNVAILLQIAGLESNPPVPRVVRESLLRIAEKDADRDATPTNTSAQILATDIGYQAIKARDTQIAALRAQLK